jgi:hypothetical protein
MYKIYCDLDGVLCDFDKAVREILGKPPHELGDKVMWPMLARQKNFYGDLDWMPDGKELWNSIKHLNPTILTGVPFGGWAPGQKKIWCGRELGYEVPVITTWSREKHLHSGPNCVLIDDRVKLREKWVEAGGIFVQHTSTANSLLELKTLGILGE